jgi:hypothetical protein
VLLLVGTNASLNFPTGDGLRRGSLVVSSVLACRGASVSMGGKARLDWG